MENAELTATIIKSAMKVHSALGPGLLESAYEACLAHELRKLGMKVEVQLELPIEYDGMRIDAGYRIDIQAEDSVILELKAVQSLLPIHEAQLLSYLRLGRKEVGLLINFHVEHLRDGIKRMVNNYRGPTI
jgi:GxxExxY protein